MKNKILCDFHTYGDFPHSTRKFRPGSHWYEENVFPSEFCHLSRPYDKIKGRRKARKFRDTAREQKFVFNMKVIVITNFARVFGAVPKNMDRKLVKKTKKKTDKLIVWCNHLCHKRFLRIWEKNKTKQKLIKTPENKN